MPLFDQDGCTVEAMSGGHYVRSERGGKLVGKMLIPSWIPIPAFKALLSDRLRNDPAYASKFDWPPLMGGTPEDAGGDPLGEPTLTVNWKQKALELFEKVKELKPSNPDEPPFREQRDLFAEGILEACVARNIIPADAINRGYSGPELLHLCECLGGTQNEGIADQGITPNPSHLSWDGVSKPLPPDPIQDPT